MYGATSRIGLPEPAAVHRKHPGWTRAEQSARGPSASEKGHNLKQRSKLDSSHPIGTPSVAGGLRTEARMGIDVPGNGGQESGAEPVRSEWWRGGSCLRSRGGSHFEVQS
jgi:hypothetical protein